MTPLPESKLVFASSNPGKIREVAEIFRGSGFTIVSQDEFGIGSPDETGATFADNALIKARHAAAGSGLPAMADDSGIVVDALGGRPGVRSARYAGEAATDAENVDRLLEEMQGIPQGQRGAGFHCAAVLVFANEEAPPIAVEAIWRGSILLERRGEGGFGYDPVFFDPASGKSGAQMTPQEKNRVSHRGRAFRELRERLLETRAPSQ